MDAGSFHHHLCRRRRHGNNLEELVGNNGSVVTEYQYEQNTHSDSQFIQDRLEQMGK